MGLNFLSTVAQFCIKLQKNSYRCMAVFKQTQMIVQVGPFFKNILLAYLPRSASPPPHRQQGKWAVMSTAVAANLFPGTAMRWYFQKSHFFPPMQQHKSDLLGQILMRYCPCSRFPAMPGPR